MSAATTPLQALHALPFAEFIRKSAWAYPALEVAHIVGIGTLLGTLLLVELRILGLGRSLDLRALSRFALPCTLTGFAVIVVSGGLLFLSRATDLISNQAFIVKMILIFAAGTNAALLHARGGLLRQDVLTKAQAVLSLALWVSVITCGRIIGYL